MATVTNSLWAFKTITDPNILNTPLRAACGTATRGATEKGYYTQNVRSYSNPYEQVNFVLAPLTVKQVE